MLRIDIDVSGTLKSYAFRAQWHADDEGQTRGELRKVTGQSEPGEVIGKVTVSWQNSADDLGSIRDAIDQFAKPAADKLGLIRGVGDQLAKSGRWVSKQFGNPDPVAELSTIEIEIDEVAAGRPIRTRPTTPDVQRDRWTLTGGQADWWTGIVVYRDGVPTPAELHGE